MMTSTTLTPTQSTAATSAASTLLSSGQTIILTTAQPSARPPNPKLCFNSDGSVQLRGDPSSFPGFGINGKSHTLLPTIGKDGKMTMLLAPIDGSGKTFILNPTNGARMPSPKIVVSPPGNATAAQVVSGPSQAAANKTPKVTSLLKTSFLKDKSSSLATGGEQSGPLKHKPIIISGLEGSKNVKSPTIVVGKDENGQIKRRPTVISNCYETKKTTSTSSTMSSSNAKYMTHMRIDPSGSTTSTVKVPLTKNQSSTLSVYQNSASTTLKNLSSTVKNNASGAASSGRGITVLSNSQNTQPFVISSNTHWTNIGSVLPDAKTRCDASEPPAKIASQFQSTNSTCSSNFFLIRPSSGNPNSAVLTGQNQSTLGVPKIVRLVSPFGLQFPQPSVTSSNVMAVTSQSPSVSGTSTTHTSSASTQSVSNSNTSTTVHSSDSRRSCSNKYCMNCRMTQFGVYKPGNCKCELSIPSSPAKPVSPILPKVKEEESGGTMELKIGSVFSLAEGKVQKNKKKTKAKNTNICKDVVGVDVKQEPMEEKVVTEKFEPMEYEAQKVTCNPCYVVLEQLSDLQIKNHNNFGFKCSSYCRLRTLNFLCSVGLLDCRTVEHVISGLKGKSSAGNYPCTKEETNPRENSVHTAMDTGSGSKKEEPETSSYTYEMTSGKNSPEKVIKFTKVDSTEGKIKMPFPTQNNVIASNSFPSVTRPATTATSLLTKQTVPLQSQVSLLTKSTNGVSTGISDSTVTKNTSPSKKIVQLKLGPKSTYPLKSITGTCNKQYCLLPLNGTQYLVPADESKKQTTLIVKTPTPLSIASPVIQSIAAAAARKSLTQTTTSNSSGLKRTSTSSSQKEVPIKTKKCDDQANTSDIRVKPEPITSGYGDEPPAAKSVQKPVSVKKKKTSSNASQKLIDDLSGGLRIKPEPVTSGYGDETTASSRLRGNLPNSKGGGMEMEWEEIWSSASKPSENPSAPLSTPAGNMNEKSSSEKSAGQSDTSTASKTTVGDSAMPELPMMTIPSTKQIAQKTAAHNERIERLRAMLREKEKEIENLKKEREEESHSLDDDLDKDDSVTDVTFEPEKTFPNDGLEEVDDEDNHSERYTNSDTESAISESVA